MNETKFMDSNEDSKPDYLIRDIPIDSLVSNRESITLIWFDSMLTKSNIPLIHLRSLNDYILLYTQKSLYLDYLMSNHKRNDHVIVILKDTDILDETHNCDQVYAILLLMLDNNKNQRLIIEKKYKKVVGIFQDQNSMIDKLQQVIIDVEHKVTQDIGDIFSTFNRKERTLQDVRHEFALFMWRQVFKVMLKAMPHTLEARQELLDQCRSYYCENQNQLNKIDEFERDYSLANTIRWYTKSCFLFRSLNKALRAEDIAGLYIFRYFISDLCTTLEAAHAEKNITRVYRGGHMSKDEIENYSVGTLVAANGFLSTSRDVQVAQRFIGLECTTGKTPSQSREDQQQFVLFTINIDWNLSPDIVAADISAQSDFPDEHEVLFDIGTTFEITEINYDCEHCLWHIQMRPSMEVAQHNREYKHYIDQQLAETHSSVLFGILLVDMGEYEQSANYFQRLLASVYRFTNQHDKALQFLQRTKLQNSNFDLARTLAVLLQILPENYIEIARTFNRLGFAYANQKQYDIALPSNHPYIAQSCYQLSLLHEEQGLN